MLNSRIRLRHLAILWTALAMAPLAAAAQVVTIKTIPVATGDQFLIHPSTRLGMAGISIGLDDPLLDPFVNPASGSRAGRSYLFGSPGYYSITEGDGGGRTLPLGVILTGDEWFGAASLALQEIEKADERWGCCWRLDSVNATIIDPNALRNRSSINHYVTGVLGRRFSRRTALGLGISHSALEAVDGVDLLYGNSVSIDQDGHATDFRLGLDHQMSSDETVQLVLLHRRLRMRHDVGYLDVIWDSTTFHPQPQLREVRNLDHTDVWGGHFEYVRPLEDGWRLGGAATLNYMTHPKIPNYELMSIPRDPGTSWAYNFGVGITREAGPLSLGAELVYEPIWSHTWADSDTTIVTADQRVIEPGEKTVDNEFRFSNSHLRMGIGREQERWGLQLGLQVHSIGYELEQENLVTNASRDLDESWLEWTPSLGLSLLFSDVQFRYAGRLISGTGRPGIAWSVGRTDLAAASVGFNFIPAPSGPLSLDEAKVFSHQIVVSVPIGDGDGRRSRRRR